MHQHVGKYSRWMYHRRAVIILLFLIQIALVFVAMGFFTHYLPYFYFINLFFTFGVAVYMVNSQWINPAFLLGWLTFIFLFPVVGFGLYLYFRLNPRSRRTHEKLQEACLQTLPWMQQSPDVFTRLDEIDSKKTGLARYLAYAGDFPTYQHSHTRYFSDGYTGFESLLHDLSMAEDYIFMEYFAVEPGTLLDRLVQVLADRVKAGVEVRLLYDGYNHVTALDASFPHEMEKLGIKACVFAPIHPFLSTEHNNRDHRKITVIDGQVAYTGGLNLADQYVNLTSPYGHWKDAMIRVEGDAVQSFISLFIQMWNASSQTAQLSDLGRYYLKVKTSDQAQGFVSVYGDFPSSNHTFGKMVYMDILNNATDYVYITSPYLILDTTIIQALAYAAKRQVDVVLIIPHVPDKKIPFLVARTHYPQLLEAGVKIYEYRPGFIHAKLFVSDDDMATVGTYNIDYRSMHLHYEDGCLLMHDPSILNIKADFESVRKDALAIDMDFYKSLPRLHRFIGRLLRIFSPLM